MRRLAAFFAVIAVTLLAVGSSAWAHVSVSPSTATKGGFATLTFQVPNEEENANDHEGAGAVPGRQPDRRRVGAAGRRAGRSPWPRSR